MRAQPNLLVMFLISFRYFKKLSARSHRAVFSMVPPRLIIPLTERVSNAASYKMRVRNNGLKMESVL